MVLAALTFLLTALPDPTALRPERMLDQTELTIDVGLAGASSATTKTPVGKLERDHYETVTTRIRAEVGITRYLKTGLVLPVVDYQRSYTYKLGITRFGDPMIMLAGGGALPGPLQDMQVAAFAELYFPTAAQIVLSPVDPTLRLSARGIVATTGGVAAYLGAFIGYRVQRDRLGLETSARGYFRARSADASNGAGFDLRAQVRVFSHLLVGVRVDGLFSFGGLDTAFISASRLASSASFVDVSVLAGWRFFRGLDLMASFTAPAFVQGTGYPLMGQVLLSYTYLPN